MAWCSVNSFTFTITVIEKYTHVFKSVYFFNTKFRHWTCYILTAKQHPICFLELFFGPINYLHSDLDNMKIYSQKFVHSNITSFHAQAFSIKFI
jgi:hypothetical protein